MKLFLTRALLLTTLVGVGHANETHCTATSSNACKAIAGCSWVGTGNSASCVETHEHVACASRASNDCENDDRCIYRNNRGNKTCTEVNLGIAGNGEFCQSMLVYDTEGDFYADVPEKGCAQGFICTVDNAISAAYGAPINGTCVPTDCNGKKVPGNCNGNIVGKEQCEATTQRVTICHRTCSEKNPWVRITIDEDAWSGEGCGHQLQHDIRDECANKAPWTAWGSNRKDYLLKFHGTRDHVKTINKFTTAEEKAYWRKWEPACPYVRNGQCCDWTDANPCCGEPGTTNTKVAPLVEVKKYAGPEGKCANGTMSELFDVLYTLPDATINWQYCYVVSVPKTSQECLYQLKMSDAAPLGGTGGALVDITTGDEFMCPEAVKYIPGKVVSGLTDPEGPFDAYVIGTGVQSLKDAQDTDSAKVTLNFQPAVEITKYAGPPGKCGVDMTAMQDDTYTTDTTFNFEYCYVIKNTGNECLYQASMIDDKLAIGGIQIPTSVEGAKPGYLCPGETVTITGPTPSNTLSGEPLVDATVTGKGQYSGKSVTDKDAAAVKIPACDGDMPNQGSGYCPMANGVVLVNAIGADKKPEDIDMIFGITPTDGSSIKFKVDSKHLVGTNMYVEYHKPSVSRGGGWSQDCVSEVVPACGRMATEIEADCLFADGEPYTLIQIYYVDPSNNSPFIFGPAKVHQCCEDVPDNIPETAVAQYSFILRCECPSTGRKLEEAKAMDVNKILALFEQ